MNALIAGSWCKKGTLPLKSRSALLSSLLQVVRAKGTGGASLQLQREYVRLGISATILQVIRTGRLKQPGSPSAGTGGSSLPRCLQRGSAGPSEQGAEVMPGLDSPLESWKCYRSQKGPSAIKNVCMYKYDVF